MRALFDRIFRALWADPTDHVSIGEHTSALRSENQSVNVNWTYTVPTGKSAMIALIALELLAQIQATSITTADRAFSEITLTPTGGSVVTVLICTLNTPDYVEGDRANTEGGSGMRLEAGDKIIGQDTFEGDSSGAGRVHMSQSLLAYEWTV